MAQGPVDPQPIGHSQAEAEPNRSRDHIDKYLINREIV
jgi:hypothetical protein